MFEAVGNAIRTRFDFYLFSYPVQYDNGPLVVTTDLWIRHTILWGGIQRIELPGTFRLSGVMLAQIRQPILLGDQGLLAVGDEVANAFRSVSFSGVTFRTPTVESFGRDGPYWLVNVQCPFFSDEVM